MCQALRLGPGSNEQSRSSLHRQGAPAQGQRCRLGHAHHSEKSSRPGTQLRAQRGQGEGDGGAVLDPSLAVSSQPLTVPRMYGPVTGCSPETILQSLPAPGSSRQCNFMYKLFPTLPHHYIQTTAYLVFIGRMETIQKSWALAHASPSWRGLTVRVEFVVMTYTGKVRPPGTRPRRERLMVQPQGSWRVERALPTRGTCRIPNRSLSAS